MGLRKFFEAVTTGDLNITTGARVSGSSSDQTVSSGPVDPVEFDDDSSAGLYDVGDDYDTTNHHYTAPVDGKYSVAAMVQALGPSADTELSIRVFVGGTERARVTRGARVTDPIIQISTVVEASASDNIDIRFTHDEGSDLDLNIDFQAGSNAAYALEG